MYAQVRTCTVSEIVMCVLRAVSGVHVFSVDMRVVSTQLCVYVRVRSCTFVYVRVGLLLCSHITLHSARGFC
jgi:hypothetical protein